MRNTPPTHAASHWTKVALRFLWLFVPLSLLLVGALVLLLTQERRGSQEILEATEYNHVGLQGEIIVAELQSVMSDLQILADSSTLHDYLRDETEAERNALEVDYRLFCNHKQVYDQVRLLDENGMEIVRVNLRQGRAEVVPQDELQTKADRYYFSETFRLARGGVFVSPFDLNVENGQIEQPAKPTIRFGAPVFDEQGRKQGIVILNYLGTALLGKLDRAARNAPGEVALLNPDGYWLHSPNVEDEWAFMYADRNHRSFAVRYPDVWRSVATENRGQTTSNEGLFTYATVYPLATARGLPPAEQGLSVAGETTGTDPGYHWHVLSRVPRSALATRPAWLTLGLPLALTGVLAIGCFLVARSRVNHEEAALALRDNEERFRQLTETIDEVFWMTTPDFGELVYVSPAYEQLWGRSCESLYQRPLSWLDAVLPEDRARVERELREGAATGQYDSEFRITLPSGMTRWIWDRGFPVRDEQGRTYRIAGLKEDVTALKAAQARVLQSERLAAIGEAMTGLAHESRNALQRSQAGLEMLARRVGDREDARELLAQTQEAQHHLHRLYEEVRDYAAPLRLHRQPIALHEVLEQAWEHLAGERSQRQAQLVQAKADSQCWGDPIALGQVFRNLLENSLHAARDPVEIKVAWDSRVCDEQESICVILEDNGPGLTAEQAAHIFDPFYTTKVRGTGLGMAICRRIIEEHGGQIAVEPSNGCGARISIVLPRSQP